VRKIISIRLAGEQEQKEKSKEVYISHMREAIDP